MKLKNGIKFSFKVPSALINQDDHIYTASVIDSIVQVRGQHWDSLKPSVHYYAVDAEEMIADGDWKVIEEVPEMKFTSGMKCRIKSCAESWYWYAHMIGEEVILTQAKEDGYGVFWLTEGNKIGIMECDLEPIVENLFEGMSTHVKHKHVTFPEQEERSTHLWRAYEAVYAEKQPHRYKVEGCIILTNTVPSEIVAELPTHEKALKLCFYMNGEI